jgi:hypothetical protein
VDVAEAVAGLSDPDRRPEAARAVAATGDRSLLPAVVEAWDSRAEASILPLVEAARALGGAEEALRLASGADAGERYLAVRLIELVGDDRHLAALEQLVSDPDAGVASTARRALAETERTDAWHAVVKRLSASPDPELAAAVSTWLEAGSRGPGIFTSD